MFEEFIIIAFSFVAITVGIQFLKKSSRLLKNGRIAKAIIFQNNYSKSGRVYYPVVRFLTENQEWITQQLSSGSTPAKKEGTKLEVIYNPDNPSEVEINSKLQLKILPVIFLILGISGLIFGILELFDITQLLNI